MSFELPYYIDHIWKTRKETRMSFYKVMTVPASCMVLRSGHQKDLVAFMLLAHFFP